MDERTAAPLAARQHDLDAVPVEQADRRRVDRGCTTGCDAAGQERDAALAAALRRIDARSFSASACGKRRRQPQHRREPRSNAKASRSGANGLPSGANESRRKRAGYGTATPSIARNSPLRQRPPIGLLDMRARMIDEVHVVHAGGAGGHAGEAREAAIDVRRHFGVGRPVVLEHVLDQIDAPARAIELVAEQHIGRAGRGAEAAMHAGAQNLVRFPDIAGRRAGRERNSSACAGYTRFRRLSGALFSCRAAIADRPDAAPARSSAAARGDASATDVGNRTGAGAAAAGLHR